MVKVSKWDFAEFLKTEADIKVYLETAFADGDPAVISAALGTAARARGMSKIAKKSGINRTSLYRALNKDKKPYFETISSVIHSLGYKLALAPQ
ncbi:MAG: putative addiction module antidote protein [Candidatus Margulisbacteria bacterium]|jgi:probable addiction module antidote protein|nr:putative addiction module antidote protein [Candidatus Margulisiibacteriota bacterium]